MDEACQGSGVSSGGRRRVTASWEAGGIVLHPAEPTVSEAICSAVRKLGVRWGRCWWDVPGGYAVSSECVVLSVSHGVELALSSMK